MPLNGNLLIGGREVAGEGAAIEAYAAADGATLGPAFLSATPAQVDAACDLAWSAFPAYSETSLADRAAFLNAVAEQILALGDALIERAMAETGLPQARLAGERMRTVNQLRLFATVVASGDWVGARIDPAMPERQPLPRADLRLRHVALGPVAVFGASNFPLAFSVAGGDTASALAAGCPVVVKGHQAHLGTSELVGRAIQAAVKACNMPEGTFSLVWGPGAEIGQRLVKHAHIKAVGFTGSRGGGMALVNAAAQRPEPIPVFAEMSSINPVILTPGALATRPEELGKAFIGSLTMGVGQFCTNPGLLLAIGGEGLDRFLASASEAMGVAPAGVMLTAGIAGAYAKGVERLTGASEVKQIACGLPGDARQGQAALFSVAADDFADKPHLSEEVFGPASLVVVCRDEAQMVSVIDRLEGQLTATVLMQPDETDTLRRVLPHLERKAGRILVNGFPTGVEVSHAMVHGGPFPATSDSRFTSVGTLAIRRFLRPVCYQDIPAAALPEALRDGNPLDLWRLVDGALGKH